MADWGKITSRGRVDDRRSFGSALGGFGSLGAFGVLALIIFSFLSSPDATDLDQILNQLQQTQVAQQAEGTNQFTGEDSYERFASAIVGSNNDLWRQVFAQNNITYTDPTLVLFRGATQSGCGVATSSVGPHYCPNDSTIYLDETFFDELTSRYGAKGGDVAEAYVIAHEVGHHVQNLLGTMQEVQAARSNEASIALELQADCYAGVWAYSVSRLGVFEQNEILEALDAAAAVGDDRIQESVTGQVNPETWTHGSSEDRQQWFSTGFTSGDPSQCNTF